MRMSQGGGARGSLEVRNDTRDQMILNKWTAINKKAYNMPPRWMGGIKMWITQQVPTSKEENTYKHTLQCSIVVPPPCGAAHLGLGHRGDADSQRWKDYKILRALKYEHEKSHLPFPSSSQRHRPCQKLASQPKRDTKHNKHTKGVDTTIHIYSDSTLLLINACFGCVRHMTVNCSRRLDSIFVTTSSVSVRHGCTYIGFFWAKNIMKTIK